MRYVIAYDVGDDRRRERVAALLEGWGRRVQRSVFECELTGEELKTVWGRVLDVLQKGEDRCRVYRVCAECLALGRQVGEDVEAPRGAVVVI
jgi:CRISPR-associated protein Cas2